ncbi:nectin-3-like isoform X1 [Cyclopterus lumpus]|nr:nectin-3-like isoform X1 [Cyclopterus lumpus]
MSEREFFRFLCAVGFFLKGQTALVQSQHTVMAAVGDSACLTCRLMQFKDVLQVTWEKILPEGKKYLATSFKYFGQKVSREFKGRVEFKDIDLHNSSIVIMNVTDQDKGCYRCLFNTYPDGALTGTTCLHLYELREVFLHVRESHAAEEVVVSCSATGRPAPTVTLTVPHYNSTSSTNANGTVTVTATAVLPRLHVNSSRVGCAVRVLSGPETVVSEVVPEVKQSPADGDDVESGSHHRWTIGRVVGVGVCVAGAAGAAGAVTFMVCWYQKRQNPQRKTSDLLTSIRVRSYENNKDIQEPRTPFMNPENKPLLRTSTAKDKNSSHPKSSVKGKTLVF